MLLGAPGGIRTPDLLIRSQLLYPLSYGRVAPSLGPACDRWGLRSGVFSLSDSLGYRQGLTNR